MAGNLPLIQVGMLHRHIHFLVDNLHDCTRFTYFTAESRTITAFAVLAVADPMKDSACFQLGCAVPPAYRKQGRGKAVALAALDEFTNGFGRLGAPAYYIEAVVGIENLASQKIAAAAINPEPVEIIDAVSGLPALHYLRKIEPARAH